MVGQKVFLRAVTIMDYHIQPSTRRCAVTGRELQPGEKYYTTLLEQKQQFVRQDYSLEAWQGPPPGAFSFWLGQVPSGSEPRRLHIDEEMLLDCFHRLEGQTEPARLNFRYVVTLLLMRRKRLKFEDVRVRDGQEWLIVYSSRDKKKYEVCNPRLTEDEIAAVQDEVFKVLGWE